MNRGDLPGYYWDEEKKRYFKVQANHLVPDGSRYAKGSVNQEIRLAKKRKVDERNRLKRENCSVKPAPVLSAPIGRIGLLREQDGFHRSRRVSEQGEAAVVAQWTPNFVRIQLEHSDSRLKDAQYIPDREMMLVASTLNNLATVIFAHDWNWDESSSQVPKTAVHVGGLHANLTSISTRSNEYGCLVIAAGEGSPSETVFTGMLPFQRPHGGVIRERGAYLSLGSPNRGHGCQDTAIHPEDEVGALFGLSGIHLLDVLLARVYSKLSPPPEDLEWPGCDAGVSWLDRNTLLYGAKETRHSVMLWDTRTQNGKAARFTVRERLTGVFTAAQPGRNGSGSAHEILASTNHRINLFDMRMPRSGGHQHESPVLSFSHVHGGPKLHRAARGSLVAAVDRDNVVQVYSIRTGTKVAQLTTPLWQPKKLESPALRKLTWYDDERHGSVLQAVRGNGVVRWTWSEGGNEADESDEA